MYIILNIIYRQRDKRKEKMQADIYLRKMSHQLAFELLCRKDEIYRS